MAKRCYKLQEFVAHLTAVNCLNISKKSCRLFITGGEDHKVNLWAIGKPTSLMSFCGHTSPVECLVFDAAETLVVAGASSGAIKLWDLEELKMVRTLTGHKSNCTAVEFHPFGEFFASGSLDTNLKIWDIRKKECIHTYRGHTGGIDSIRFTPDGRWVVSGGFDNVVKVWDLTAGKPLHDFKSHEGPIQSIDFHPLEFLLATGSADRTVKFWDLESFELIGSSKPEASGVLSIKFHPDGRSLLCGLDDSLKIYSWEPVICHDTIDMGWSRLGDFCIHEGKLLGCSYYRNSVGVWVIDISLMDPFGATLDHKHCRSTKNKIYLKERQPSEKNRGDLNVFCCISPEPETIKNIYVDCEKPVDFQKVSSQNSLKETPPSEYKKFTSKTKKKPNPNMGAVTKYPGKPIKGTFVVPNVVAREHIRKSPSNRKDNSVALLTEHGIGSKFQTRVVIEDEDKKAVSTQLGVTEKFPETVHHESNKQISPTKPLVAAVMPGRTRSLVDKFERESNRDDHSPVQTSLPTIDKPQLFERETMPPNHGDISEDLMQGHDDFISTLRSRLTKLQAMHQFWERNDIKGCINAMKKLPDHAVQADLISILNEKTDILTLDLFSCLLPILSSLLGSKMERHLNVSLEMLLKLVAVFGSIVRSAVSSPRPVGVDLHAEQRIECCKRCSILLQKINKMLPTLSKRGGVVARCSEELSLLLHQS